MGPGGSNLHVGRSHGAIPLSGAFERGVEPAGRLPQQEDAEGVRLGLESGRLQDDHSKMGGSHVWTSSLRGRMRNLAFSSP